VLADYEAHIAALLDKFYPRQGKPTQLSFDYQGERTEDDGKGL